MIITNIIEKILTYIRLKRLKSEIEKRNQQISSVNQVILSSIYKSNYNQKLPLPNLSEVGYKIHSQTDEDGIILYIFSLIGIMKKLYVEIGISGNLEGNCTNLAINFGWHGLFIDGDKDNTNMIQLFLDNNPSTRLFPPKVINRWITKENIDKTIVNAGFKGEIDLLSIDIDGMDYWIWNAIKSINPRVVIIEANAKLGLHSITIPYTSNWHYSPEQYPHYHGASLPALIKLGKKKGYRLIGTNLYGFNAFFIRNDIGRKIFPTVSVNDCRVHPTRENDSKIFSKIQKLPFIKI